MVDGREIPDRLIASALEFAVGIAAAGVKSKPPLPVPAQLAPFLKFQKLTGKALADVRRTVEADLRSSRPSRCSPIPSCSTRPGCCG